MHGEHYRQGCWRRVVSADWDREALGITASCVLQDFIRERMQAGYDPGYLRQIFDFIVYTISCMEAPARRESTQKARLSPSATYAS